MKICYKNSVRKKDKTTKNDITIIGQNIIKNIEIKEKGIKDKIIYQDNVIKTISNDVKYLEKDVKSVKATVEEIVKENKIKKALTIEEIKNIIIASLNAPSLFDSIERQKINFMRKQHQRLRKQNVFLNIFPKYEL